MLQAALEAEVDAFVEGYKKLVDSEGKRIVVRNGRMPERTVLTGAGTIGITRHRVDDRALEGMGKERFTSTILPRFMRRAPSIDTLVPVLYLKGVSTDDFPTALEAILGPGAKGLSATTVARLKEVWTAEYERSCLLVVIGADSFGNKELLAVLDGFRESTQSWRELLADLRSRGLEQAPALAVCDGAMGFRAACAEVWPETRIQRCWFRKSGNVLDRLPKAIQAKAKDMLHLRDRAATAPAD